VIGRLRRARIGAGALVLSAALAAPAAAATTEVGANGNILGGLSFTPAKVSVAVGDVVSWRNTDFIAPHTATEDHRLWDLGGSYGATPLNPAGFGPATTVSRPFEAGSQSYYCVVHPVQMKGRVDVPVMLGTATVPTRVRVKVRVKRRRGQRRPRYRYKRVSRNVKFVTARWAPAALAGGLVMDVERRSGAPDPWRPLATGTTAPTGRFKAGKRGTIWEVRARLRKGNAATDWSPVAQISG
jgi:plastocyanin